MNNYLTYKDFEDTDKIFAILPSKSEDYWLEGAKYEAFKVFTLLKDKIPAYKKFLQENKVSLKEIKDLGDWEKIPVMTKDNYIRRFGYKNILNGKPSTVKSFYMSSGTTGEPDIWPRFEEADKAYSVLVNFFYTLYWQIDKKKTLYISAMDLGIWASGNLQFNAAKYCSHRHNFTFANPGADFRYIYMIIKNLAKHYDLVVIATYPSVARKILDYLLEKKDIDLKKINLKFMLGGEAHTLEWRHYVLEKIGLSPTDLTGVLDYYGTSDSGGPGSSTPLTALIQNICKENSKLCRELFGQSVVPSLFQRNPTLHVESVEGNIVVTYPGQIPLCRYDSEDMGGVLKFSEVMSKVSGYGYDVKALLEKEGFGGRIWKWPFIYLTGRSDDAVSIGGAIVYPKDIEGIFFKEDARKINSFKIGVGYDREQHQRLAIYLELKSGISLATSEKERLSLKLKKLILEKLMRSNPDYAAAYDMEPESCDPNIVICDFEVRPFSGESKKHKPSFVKK